jgi:alkanesulfonate monooxygenase SsuD/methylene tetrahydromethanopterin reductase-like flavin-dependent oxidoreductase (luciferase family)
MEFGIFSNGERTNQLAAETYDEDVYEIVTADKLGLKEAWVSEHVPRGDGSSRPDTVPVADLLICKAGALTKQIRLGPAIRPVSFYQPIQVAMEAAMCDQLLRGRYMFGFGLSGPAADAMSMRGIGDDNSTAARRARTNEATELILKCWTEYEPFDWKGEYYSGKGINILPKPYQKPWPLTGVASSSGNLGPIELAANKGFMPLFSQNDEAGHLKKMVDAYVEAGKKAGRRTRRADVRASRFVYISDSTEKAKEELRPTVTPSLERRKKQYPHHFAFHMPPSGKIEDITWDQQVECGHYIVGDAERVYQLLVDFYKESGGFGTLLLVLGKDFGTRQQRMKSLKLFMREVAPRLRDLNPDR